VNIVLFLLGDSPASEFRRRGISQKEEYNNKPIIDNFVEVLVQNITVIQVRGGRNILLNSQDYATADEPDVSSP
jgi:hypothetical protein